MARIDYKRWSRLEPSSWLKGAGMPLALLVLLCILLLLPLGRSLHRMLSAAAEDRRFDALEWRDPARAHSGERETMVRDLLRSGALLGVTREEAIAMLGEPGPGRSAELGEWDLAYWVAPEPAAILGAESRWLVLRFDAEGRASEVRVVTAIREPD